MKMWLFVLLIICVAGLSACDIETSGNGDLDGFWRLEQVDSIGNGKIVPYVDHSIYWSFQHKLLQLNNLHDNTVVYKLVEENRVLQLNDPCIFDRSEGDTPVTDLAVLRPYGVNALQEQFRIVTLESEKLVLESSVLRLHFRKY